MPTVLRKFGYRFHFFSADGEEPPHIHIDKDGCRGKVWLNSVKTAKTGGFNNQEMSTILTIISEHREEMIEAWYDFFK